MKIENRLSVCDGPLTCSDRQHRKILLNFICGKENTVVLYYAMYYRMKKNNNKKKTIIK